MVRNASGVSSRTLKSWGGSPCRAVLALPSLRGDPLAMQTVTLTAHFDGDHIQLDERFDLPANVRLLVTIPPAASAGSERADWYALSKAGLARAYSDD
jgi:hypothetical protein